MGFRINLQINVGNFKVTARLDLVFYCCNVLSKFIPLETSTSISVCQCFVDYCLVSSINYTTRVFLQIVLNYIRNMTSCIELVLTKNCNHVSNSSFRHLIAQSIKTQNKPTGRMFLVSLDFLDSVVGY